MNVKAIVVLTAAVGACWGSLWGCYPEDTDHAVRDTKTSISASAEPKATASATQPYGSSQQRVTPDPKCGNGSLKITSPKDGAVIRNGAQGVEIKGIVCLPGGEALWKIGALSRGQTPSDLRNSPVTDTSGAFSYQTGPLGRPGDDNQPVVINLLYADLRCATTLSVQTDNPASGHPPGMPNRRAPHGPRLQPAQISS